jgi:hypothetical protein
MSSNQLLKKDFAMEVVQKSNEVMEETFNGNIDHFFGLSIRQIFIADSTNIYFLAETPEYTFRYLPEGT